MTLSDLLKWRAIAAATLILTPAAATAAEHDPELWLTAGASGALYGRLLLSLEAVTRFSDDENGIYESEFGGFLGYQLTDDVALWAGYVRVPRYRRGGPTSVEDRTRQQITANLGKAGGGSLSGRVRLEQRFRDGGGTGWRLRPQIKYSRPFAKDGPALVISHESFVPLNDTGWGQQGGYERMRNFVGLGLGVAEGVKAEIGYLNQYNFRSGAEDSVDHAASLTLSYSF